MTHKEIAAARSVAGWRENYAMDHGASEIIYMCGHKCYKFTYSENDPYQDANGATFDTVRGVWIN